jgi:hypothetical protein
MSNRKWESDMANEKFEDRHIICEVRSKSLDSSAPMFGQRWPGKIGRIYWCRRRLWDSNCRRSCRQDSPQIEGQQIAVEHGRRLHHDLAERHGRQLDWVPPVSHTPGFTTCATSRKWPWRVFVSDQVLTIAIAGLPAKSLSVSPFCSVRDRCANE